MRNSTDGAHGGKRLPAFETSVGDPLRGRALTVVNLLRASLHLNIDALAATGTGRHPLP
jgi:hypothetical protein